MKILKYSIVGLTELSDYWHDVITLCVKSVFDDQLSSNWLNFPSLILFATANSEGILIEDKEPLILLEGEAVMDNIVGFKFGSFRNKDHYHSSKGGVFTKYRRMGIAKALQTTADKLIQQKGVNKYTFNTFPNLFPEMFIFGLKYGYTLYDIKLVDHGVKVFFQKNFDNSKIDLNQIENYGKGKPIKDYTLLLEDHIKITGWKVSKNELILLNDQL